MEVNLLNFVARHFPAGHFWRAEAIRTLQLYVARERAPVGRDGEVVQLEVDPARLSITTLNCAMDVTGIIAELEAVCPEDMLSSLVDIYVSFGCVTCLPASSCAFKLNPLCKTVEVGLYFRASVHST